MRDLPNSLVEIFNVLGNAFNLLNTAIEGKERVFDVRVPKTHFDQVSNEVRVNTDELSS